jgi:hypothetical protein
LLPFLQHLPNLAALFTTFTNLAVLFFNIYQTLLPFYNIHLTLPPCLQHLPNLAAPFLSTFSSFFSSPSLSSAGILEKSRAARNRVCRTGLPGYIGWWN